MSDLSTQLIHHPYTPPEGFEATAPGVHKASTVIFPNVAAMHDRDWKRREAYTYGLHGTPTTFTLEARIATLEGGQHCLLAPSGLSAVSLVDMAFLKTGDELLIPDNAYGPGKTFAEGELADWGISLQFYDAMKPSDLAAKLNRKTRLVWLEAPGSVTLEFPDIPALVAVVKAHNANAAQAHPLRVVTALDNTWGAGLAFNAFELGADVAVQALTKYPSGGGDVLMGSVVTRDVTLHDTIQLCHMRLGLSVSGNDSELVLRGLGSMALRYAAQDAAARALATWLQSQPQIAAVLHPALPDSPGHAAWKRDCKGAACLFSAVFKPELTQQQINHFCDSLKLFKIGYSWAGPMSLCVPYNIQAVRSLPWPHQGGLVRFAVGLEAVADLQADIAQALAAMHYS
ncbi:cystathionine beta-lyase [Polaromonas sp. OV174]|uniref:PLP-dependent transferase n=1 Tax=Polaromonas sp. OV174 TaxID=1855300 RepID=UPI0008F33F60|nr:PLP-dependent transferase [Polaromonas sp. OV174]SFC41206.1 cystathionine beta-lyase [Polaromonas sp. OV174]